MIFIDALSRHFIAVPAPKSAAETVARIFVTEVMCKFGSPLVLITHNGAAFRVELFEHVCKSLNVARLTTAPYASQSDGSVERAHRTVKAKLRRAVGRGGVDWRERLALVVVVAAMDCSTRAAGLSAAEIVFGRPPTVPTGGRRY